MDNLEEIKKQISELQSKVNKLENENKKENKRWRAEKNDRYFYINDCGSVFASRETRDYVDEYRFKTRNYFKTEEEALEYKQVMITYYNLMDLAEELNKGRKIDWNDGSQCKYSIYYNYEIDKLQRTCSFRWKDLGQIYCLDKNFKEKAIEKIGEDRLKKLFTYERS